MALSIRDYKFIKEVEAIHHQGHVRNDKSRVTLCSCISLMSVTWPLFRFLNLRDKFDLDCIIGKIDWYLKLLANLDILGWKAYHKSSS